MRFRKEKETRLERELRAQRPQPREEFVQMLARQVEPLRPARRSALPKLALVAAVTAALAVSLGTAGALGAAGGSVHRFSVSVAHLVAPQKTAAVTRTGGSTGAPTPAAPTSSRSASSTVTTTTPTGTTDYSNATPTHWPPFNAQYGILIPICYQGHIIYVTPRQIVWYVFHGALPARRCTPDH